MLTQRGVTLIELMIATAIALFALSMVLTVYLGSARHSSLHLQRAHLHQQLHGVLNLMTADLKRAGYWWFDPRRRSPADNPFQQPDGGLRVMRDKGESPNSCVLYAYDLDSDGRVGVGKCRGRCESDEDSDNVEQFGFRLRAGSVQARYGGTQFGCSSGYWQALNDPQIEITRLYFEPHFDCRNLLDPTTDCSAQVPRMTRRALDIELAGRLRNDPAISLSLDATVALANELIEGAVP